MAKQPALSPFGQQKKNVKGVRKPFTSKKPKKKQKKRTNLSRRNSNPGLTGWEHKNHLSRRG
jgi:hypothetical protein